MFSKGTVKFLSNLKILQKRVQERIFSSGECLVKTFFGTNFTDFVLLSSKE